MKGIELEVFIYDEDEIKLSELDIELKEKDLRGSDTVEYFFPKIDFFHRHRKYPNEFSIVYSGGDSMAVKMPYKNLKKLFQDGTT